MGLALWHNPGRGSPASTSSFGGSSFCRELGPNKALQLAAKGLVPIWLWYRQASDAGAPSQQGHRALVCS